MRPHALLHVSPGDTGRRLYVAWVGRAGDAAQVLTSHSYSSFFPAEVFTQNFEYSCVF